MLRLTAVSKFSKALTLILIGLCALKLMHTDSAGALTHWALRLGIDPGGRRIDRAIGNVASLPSGKLREFGFGSYVYAALLLVEGPGLWLGKRWAECFTFIINGSLVPLGEGTAGLLLVFADQRSVVVYLLWRIRGERAHGREQA